MCGRYVLYGPHSRLREYFDLRDSAASEARSNIAPQSDNARTETFAGKPSFKAGPAWRDVDALKAWLSPAPAANMAAWPAGSRVSSVHNEGEDLIEPI